MVSVHYSKAVKNQMKKKEGTRNEKADENFRADDGGHDAAGQRGDGGNRSGIREGPRQTHQGSRNEVYARLPLFRHLG